MNSPTWALVTEAKRMLVLVSTDIKLIRNIQLCVSKHVLLNLVPWSNEEVRFDSDISDIREKLLFVKSVIVNQQVYAQQILDEYEPVNRRDIQLLEISREFYQNVMPTDEFIPATIAAELADLTRYYNVVDQYTRFIYSILFNLNYASTVQEVRKSFAAAITDIKTWPDQTDRFFIFGKMTRMHQGSLK
jgi:hypothetical protein